MRLAFRNSGSSVSYRIITLMRLLELENGVVNDVKMANRWVFLEKSRIDTLLTRAYWDFDD
jgi:hypothetical protein